MTSSLCSVAPCDNGVHARLSHPQYTHTQARAQTNKHTPHTGRQTDACMDTHKRTPRHGHLHIHTRIHTHTKTDAHTNIINRAGLTLCLLTASPYQ